LIDCFEEKLILFSLLSKWASKQGDVVLEGVVPVFIVVVVVMFAV